MNTGDAALRPAYGILSRPRALVVGLVAALIMTALMLLFRLGTGQPALPELVSDAVIALIPGPLFSFVLDHLGSSAKPALFLALLAAQILLGGLLGLLYVAAWNRSASAANDWVTIWRSGLSGSVTYAVLLWLVVMLVVLPVTGSGFFGLGNAQVQWLLAGSSLLAFWSYGASLFVLRDFSFLPSPSDAQEVADAAGFHKGRRALVGNTILALVSVAASGAVGALLWQFSKVATITKAATNSHSKSLSEVTSNEDFYVVSKNFVDPVVNRESWGLTIDGLVGNPLTLRYEDITSLPAVTQYTTLECISNPVGGDLMSNALWKGVPLRVLLEQARAKPEATELIFRCSDDYSDSIPLDKGLLATTLVVYEMNGEPLSHKHGFPVRLVVPGIYGMKNVKWLTKVTLTDQDYKGFWEQAGWSDTAIVKTTSRIDEPVSGDVSPGDSVIVAGVAFAGDRGISKVEVSFDDGKSWKQASARVALSPFTWVLWATDRTPLTPGSHKVKVRATDGAGAVQEAERAEPYPDGASGLHQIYVRIVTP